MRSSGHDFVGRSTWDGSININLSEMKDYEVNLDSSRSDHGEVKVQTGLSWAEIYKMVGTVRFGKSESHYEKCYFSIYFESFWLKHSNDII
jgi:hypothetical protein